MGIGTALTYIADKYTIPVSVADAAQDFESWKDANPNVANPTDLASALTGAAGTLVAMAELACDA